MWDLNEIKVIKNEKKWGKVGESGEK